MSLIVCPHCGKQVSDTVERCIHCGGAFLKGEPKVSATDFNTLDKEIRKSLEVEFQKGYPKYVCPHAKQNALKCRRKFKVCTIISYVACVIFFLILILVKTKVLDIDSNDIKMMVVVLVALCAALVILISAACKISYKLKSKKLISQYLLYEKLFQVWLLHTNNIFKEVDFSDLSGKEKKYFENINTDLYT